MPMSVHNKPSARQIQPIAFSGRLEAIRAPTSGKTRKSPPPKRAPTVPQVLEGRVSGAPDKNKRVSATPATNMVRERPASDQASQEEARELIPPPPRSCSVSPSVTTPLYRTTVSQTSRRPLRERRAAANFAEHPFRDCLKIPNEPHRGAPPRGRDGVESVISQPRVPPNTRAQETCSDFSDSLFTEFSEVRPTSIPLRGGSIST